MEPQDSPTFNTKKLKLHNQIKQKAKKNNNNEGDRISDLPEPILHQILSFVDLKQAVQTSILSTRWRYFWKSLPILNFNSEQFEVSRWKSVKNINFFIEFVEKVLHLRDRSSNIQRLNLSCSYRFDRSITLYLRDWIRIALIQNVQELYLDITNHQFSFPFPLLTCKWLQVLSLKYSGSSKHCIPYSMSLPSLKTLAFSGFLFEGDDIPNRIFSSCPNMESLTITFCHFNKVRFDISSLKLKHLVIDDCHDFCCVKLFAPNLISVRIGDYVLNDYCFENLFSLVEAEININHVLTHGLRKEMYVERMMKFLMSLQNVKTLTLSGQFLQVFSGAPAVLECTSTQFCNLRCLKLGTWLSRDCVGAMTYLLENSPNMETLFVEIKVNLYKLDLNYPYWDKVRFNSAKIEEYSEEGLSLRYNLYHLKFVEIRGVRGCNNELMFLEILLKHSLVLEKVVLYTSKEQTPHGKDQLSNFSMQILTLPRASPSVDLLMLE